MVLHMFLYRTIDMRLTYIACLQKIWLELSSYLFIRIHSISRFIVQSYKRNCTDKKISFSYLTEHQVITKNPLVSNAVTCENRDLSLLNNIFGSNAYCQFRSSHPTSYRILLTYGRPRTKQFAPYRTQLNSSRFIKLRGFPSTAPQPC